MPALHGAGAGVPYVLPRRGPLVPSGEGAPAREAGGQWKGSGAGAAGGPHVRPAPPRVERMETSCLSAIEAGAGRVRAAAMEASQTSMRPS